MPAPATSGLRLPAVAGPLALRRQTLGGTGQLLASLDEAAPVTSPVQVPSLGLTRSWILTTRTAWEGRRTWGCFLLDPAGVQDLEAVGKTRKPVNFSNEAAGGSTSQGRKAKSCSASKMPQVKEFRRATADSLVGL